MVKLTPTLEQIEQLRKTAPAGPIVITNLLRFKPNGGREAYAAYLRAAKAANVDHDIQGPEVIFVGQAVEDVGTGELWDYVIIARYPCFEDFARVVSNPAYQETEETRQRALDRTIMLVTSPHTISDFLGEG